MSLLTSIFTQKIKTSALILVFLFPILMATVGSAVSTTYLLLLILGSIHIKKFTANLSPQEKTVLIGFVIVFLIYLLGMVNSDDIYNGFKKLGKFSYFLLSAPVFFLFKYYQQSVLKAFYTGTTLSGFILLIYLLLNKGSTGAYHSIMYGDFSMLLAGVNIFFSLLLTKIKKTERILFALSALCAISASLIVGAKGSWLALPLLFSMFLYLLVMQKQLRLKIMAAFVAIILTIGVTIKVFPNQVINKFNAIITNTTQFVENENNNKQQQTGSASERLVLWKAAIDTVKKYPFFGSGSGDFWLELKRFIQEYPKYSVVDGYGSAHNIFFGWLALFGIIGFLALILTVFLLPLRFFFQVIKNNPEKLWIGLIGVWIVLSSMIFGLTETWIVRSAPNGVYLFFILLFLAFSSNKDADIDPV